MAMLISDKVDITAKTITEIKVDSNEKGVSSSRGHNAPNICGHLFFNKGAEARQWRKAGLHSTGAGTTGQPCTK